MRRRRVVDIFCKGREAILRAGNYDEIYYRAILNLIS
jgi:hypothetical protein